MIEKWKEYYSESEIKKIQEIELDSLKYFIKLCQNLDIDFMLYGGTLLGAVKYKGFVPWDDDLDLALMRDDYQKLIKEGPALLSDKYEIQHPLINNVTPFSYIKFRRTDTFLAEYTLHDLKMNHGVYFDIYPIDNIPDDNQLMMKQYKSFTLLSKIFYVRQVKNIGRPVNSIKDVVMSFIRSVIYYSLRCIPHAYFINRLNKIMTQYNGIKTKRKGNYYHPKPNNFFNKIFPLVELEFEGLKLKAANDYNSNLYYRYGNINELPPLNKQVGHHAYIKKF